MPAAEMQLYNQMVPHACQNPSHVRTFIGYIESGLAATLKEASDCVEEYIHRERMEQLAEKQVTTTLNIQNSIDQRQFKAVLLFVLPPPTRSFFDDTNDEKTKIAAVRRINNRFIDKIKRASIA